MTWVIYGANGYTGRIVTSEAVKRGLKPVLAGRNRTALEEMGETYSLETRVFDLTGDLGEHIQDAKLVLHCAGPFSATSAPMLNACLERGVHYLDITGEIDVFEAAWKRHDEARKADIVVCPGTGFDVVPTDCLAATLVESLPAATSLTLAFEAGGGLSRGTARTSVEGLGKGGRVRKDGALVSVPVAWKQRNIPFSKTPRTAVTIPWGDVFTAWVSTGVPDIEVYLSMPPATIKRMRMMGKFGSILGWSWVQSLLKKRVDASIKGPDGDLRATTGVQVWGEVISADGRRMEGWLEGPNGYDITVTASLGIVEHLLEHSPEGGFYTPSLLMGSGYAAALPGVKQRIGTESSD